MDSIQSLESKKKTLESRIKLDEMREKREREAADKVNDEVKKASDNVISLERKRVEAAEQARQTQEKIDEDRRILRETERDIDTLTEAQRRKEDLARKAA